MPEYLAPGVYVEETSFRSKSIEGVSTSTTAFVGPTRRGPIFDPNNPRQDDMPELLTSVADFQRIYGGLDDLVIGPNYLAHAVKAYFENGGSRLFVSRVFQPNSATGRAGTPPLLDLTDEDEETSFVARFPGSAGNGRLHLRQVEAPASLRSLQNAPAGSMFRLRQGESAQPAMLEGVAPPFALTDGGRLLLTAGGEDVEVEFLGRAVEVRGTALTNPVTLTGDDLNLHVTVDDVSQIIAMPATPVTARRMVDHINARIRAGFARLETDNSITIGSDRRGLRASISINANPGLGFTPTGAETTVHRSGEDDLPNNNVGDLLSVTADELNALIAGQTDEVRAALSSETGRLILATTEAGEGATIEVRDGDDAEDAVATTLGFTPGATDEGEGTGSTAYYVKRGGSWTGNTGAPALDFNTWTGDRAPAGFEAHLLTLTIEAEDGDGNRSVFEDLGFDSEHPRWVGHALAQSPSRRADALTNPFAVAIGEDVDPFELRASLFATSTDPTRPPERTVTLTGGSDGVVPTVAAYERALQAFERIDDISIVASPGSAALPENIAQGVMNAMISHVERRRAYRIAVLDTPPNFTATEAQGWRSVIDSTKAALYYPWVVIPNPNARPSRQDIPMEISVPPSGFICGIYARNDVERGVFKAPANEIVRGALRFEMDVNFAQQEFLNPQGINCLRFFPGRGYRVWGARTVSSDPEWKYVNIRRYFNYLERSIDVGTQWSVFEPNGERLWANIRETIASFLYNEWVSGALLGGSPQEAFFVRCDRSTMTQNDLDNGRLICLIGVAAIKPAEFVIFRIGQKTADASA
jgi:uncharacterized protein